MSAHRKSLNEPLLDASPLPPSEHTEADVEASCTNKWRQWIYYHILNRKWFQIYILLSIVGNLCVIAIDSMVPHSYLYIHIIFLALFTLEMLLKVAGFGCIHRIVHDQIPFFRHPYHVVDLAVICVSWFTLLRFKITCTALRIVFIIFFCPILEFAVIAIAILKSFKNILKMFLIFAIFYILFGIFGVYWMSGILHNRCFEDDASPTSSESSDIFCAGDDDCMLLSNGTYPHCLPFAPNPLSHLVSFDNIFHASLQVFIASTGHWAVMLSYVVQTYGHWSIVLYWLMLTFLFFFILLPMLLAFITDTFSDANLTRFALYLNIPTNTRFSCATANVTFYRFAATRQESMYLAQQAQVVKHGKKSAHQNNRQRYSIELQNLEPTHSSSSREHSVANDDLLSTLSRSAQENDTKASTSDLQGLAMMANPDLRDRQLVALIMRKSERAVLIGKREFDAKSACRQRWYAFVHSSIWFETFVMFCIIANVVCLSLRNRHFAAHTNRVIALVNDVFVYVYALELLLRVLAAQTLNYLQNSSAFDILDSLVIVFALILNLVYVIDPTLDFEQKYINGLGGLISFRLLRTLYFMRHIAPRSLSNPLSLRFFEHFNRMIAIIMDAFSSMLWLFLMLVLFLFICGYFGTSLYHNSSSSSAAADLSYVYYDENNAFNNIVFAMLSTFEIGTGQDWVETLSNTIQLSDGSMWSVLLFVVIVAFGVFIFPSYFIALSICSIDKHQNEDAEILQSVLPIAEKYRKNELLRHELSEEDLAALIEREIKQKRQQQMESRIYNYLFTYRDQTVMFGRSLSCFLPNNYYRKKVHAMVTSLCYQRFIQICIIVNACLFGVYNMNDLINEVKSSAKSGHIAAYYVLYAVDVCFVSIFCMEILLHVIAFGLRSQSSSLTRNWSKYGDVLHIQNWRTRCLQCWKVMCRYDAYFSVNASLYDDDLGIYEIIKSNNGQVICWLVIPSCGLEVRILFMGKKWRTIYCCKQYQSTMASASHEWQRHNPDEVDGGGGAGAGGDLHLRDESTSTAFSMDILPPSHYQSDYHGDDDAYDTEDDEQKYDRTQNSRKASHSRSERVKVTKAGYGYDAGRKLYRHSMSHTDDTRKWEKWSVHTAALTPSDQNSKANFRIDRSVEQLLTSVNLSYANTNAFAADAWNILDALVVLISALSLGLNLKIWSTLRGLRLFRVVIRHPKMRQILIALRKSLSSLLSFLIFMFLVYFIASIIGLHLFYDSFNKCTCNQLMASTFTTPSACVSNIGLLWNEGIAHCVCNSNQVSALTHTQCDANPALSFSMPYFRFDAIFSSLLSVFLVSRGSQWNYFLYEHHAQNVPSIHETEQIAASGVYFLSVVFIGQYCLLSLLMAIIISNYIRYYNEGVNYLLNEKQRKSLQRVSIFIKTFRSKYCRISPFINYDDCRFAVIFHIRSIADKIVSSRCFQHGISATIVANVLLCCLEHYTFRADYHGSADANSVSVGTVTDAGLQWFINDAQIAFTAVYTFEIVLKLVAGGFAHCWSLKSYRFCCVITSLSWLCIVLAFVTDYFNIIVPINALMLLRMIVRIQYFEFFWQILKWSQTALFYQTIVMFVVLFLSAVFLRFIFGQSAVSHLHRTPSSQSSVAPSDFGNLFALLSSPTALFENVPNTLYFIYVYAFNTGNAWLPLLIECLEYYIDWLFILCFVLLYIVIVTFYSLFYAIFIDAYNDWRKVQSIQHSLEPLQMLKLQYDAELHNLRRVCVEHQLLYRVYRRDLKIFSNSKHEHSESINVARQQSREVASHYSASTAWKEFIVADNLFNTFIPAVTFLHILSRLPSPVGFERVLLNDSNLQALFVPSNLVHRENRRLPADVYRKLILFFTDLKIPIRRNRSNSGGTEDTHRASTMYSQERRPTNKTTITVTATAVPANFMELTPSPQMTPMSSVQSTAKRSFTPLAVAFEPWDYICNFSDIIHAFTWKLLSVDVLVGIEDDEQYILDWFVSHWDSYHYHQRQIVDIKN